MNLKHNISFALVGKARSTNPREKQHSKTLEKKNSIQNPSPVTKVQWIGVAV